ncbi:MAG: hypothetical protein ACRDFB_02795 [Rhabdochlamydiaceae bacterium]
MFIYNIISGKVHFLHCNVSKLDWSGEQADELLASNGFLAMIAYDFVEYASIINWVAKYQDLFEVAFYFLVTSNQVFFQR